MTFPNQPVEQYPNPWQLTPAEEKWLVRYDKHGTALLTAKAFGNSVYTVREALYSARKKMNVPSKAAAVIKYKMWHQKAEVAELNRQIEVLKHQLEANRHLLFVANRDLQQYQAYHRQHQNKEVPV